MNPLPEADHYRNCLPKNVFQAEFHACADTRMEKLMSPPALPHQPARLVTTAQTVDLVAWMQAVTMHTCGSAQPLTNSSTRTFVQTADRPLSALIQKTRLRATMGATCFPDHATLGVPHTHTSQNTATLSSTTASHTLKRGQPLLCWLWGASATAATAIAVRVCIHPWGSPHCKAVDHGADRHTHKPCKVIKGEENLWHIGQHPTLC